MEPISQLWYGFSVALEPYNLFYVFLGVLVGTVVGVLPGIGPSGAMAILLPLTTKFPPETAIIMLCGIMYGGMYGGSTTSILMNIPGEPASVITCLDGYKMSQQGRAGPALGISAFGSYIAGTISIFGLIFLAPTLASFGLRFGPVEFVSLMIFAFIALSALAIGSQIKAMIMVTLGVMLGTIGLDVVSGEPRFTFGLMYLWDGLPLIPILMGLFGIGEILVSLERFGKVEIFEKKIKGLLPTLQDWKDSIFGILRATGLSFLVGIIPGSGVVIPTFLSYTLEKRISKEPSKFGKGFIGGVAAAEAANNAAANGALVPMLSLGIPHGPATALLLAGLMLHGIQPGPLLIKEAPQVFWGLIASLYVGNIMLLVLNLPLIGLWVRILKIPYQSLSVSILLLCLIGAYAYNNSAGDIITMVIFGIIGYIAKKTDFELAPMIVGLILGKMLEENFRRSLLISDGSFSIFLTRPISLVFVVLSMIALLVPLFLRRKPIAM